MLPQLATAQLCQHGIGANEAVFGTNCLGQLVQGKTEAGGTVGVALTLIYTDTCVGDESLVTNVTDNASNGTCAFNSTTGNLLSAPVLLSASNPNAPVINVVSGPFAGAAYTYTVPANCRGTNFHQGNVNARDTNSTLNANGPLSASPSAQLQVLHPAICVGKTCTNGVGEDGLITFTGSVTNCGDTTLNGVVVTNFVNGGATQVFGPMTLAPGDSATFSGSYHPNNICSPTTDTLVASGTDELLCTVNATNSATCSLILTPCIDISKTCDATEVPGGTVNFSGTITNCGNVTLTNIVVRDTVPGVQTNVIVIGPITLAPHTSSPYTGSYTVPANFCGRLTNTVTVTANDACGGPVGPDTASCITEVACPPKVCIDKQVACAPSTGVCGPTLSYANTATGVTGAGFCYRIIIENCGQDALNSVVVSDPDLGGTLGGFPATLAIGQRATNFFPKTWSTGGTHVNTATVSGVGASSGISTNATDTATAVVVPIGVQCSIILHSEFDMDAQAEAGQPDDNHVTLGDSGPVDFSLTVNNTGQADLSVVITGLPCSEDLDGNPIPTTVVVPAGGSTNFTCSVEVSCPQGTNFSVSVTGTAVASTSVPCVFDSSGNAITTGPSTCNASVNCQQPVTCRVTGGGVLTNGMVDLSCIQVVTTISPLVVNGLTVNKVTHGGQLGAPFSQMDCGAILGNPCIRGQWEHVRHYQGKGNPRDVIDMNFHTVTPKGQFDSLFCACLGCCDPATGAFIPPSIGPLIHKFALCNPDDHKVCGPMPRPAPANAIIFSGLGRLTPTSDTGVDASKAQWVVFRVYIEDRSEPGGFHPKGAVEPADIYCFQAWKTGILTSKKPDFSTIAATFRQALGQANCDFVNALSSGDLPIGSLPSPTVDGLTADIQDCGALLTGNHQIHPSTGATCNQ